MSESDEPTKKLSSTQNKAIASLVTGATQQEAADAAGVSAKTIWRWLAYDVPFADELRKHSALAMHQARLQLAGNLETAVSTMVQIMTAVKPAQGSGVRLRAAKMVIDSALRVAEFSDIVERLAAIEAKLAGGE